jgi:flagellar hook-associated protein 2
MSTSNSTDPSKLLGVTIDPGTALGSYDIEVIQKAKANRIASNAITDPTAALGKAGTFDLALGTGISATVNVTSGMSLNDLADAINASSATSKVSASVIKTSSTSYQLVLTGTELAKDIQISNVTGDNVLQAIGVTSGTTPANVLQTGDKAIIELDGVEITRDTNTFNDLIKGVNFSILNAEPGTIIDLGIQNDTSSVKNAVLNFTEAYNNLRDFIVTNQQISPGGEIADDAVLFGDQILKNMTTQMQSLIAGVYGTGGTTSLSNLRDLGITLDQNNKFVVDETKLDTAILSNYDQVKSMFTTQTTIDNSNFAILSNKSKITNLNLTLDITADATGVTGVSVGGDNSLFDFSGTSITGKAGTIYEGLNFAYVGTTSTSVNFTMKQGFADLFDTTLKTFSDSATGAIASQKLDLGDQNTEMNARADRIRERADEYRTKLIDKYAGYEAQIARSKSIIDQLRAILGTDKNN